MHHEILASSSWTAMKLKKKGSKGCRDTAASQLRISYELLENKNPIDKLTVISTTKSTVRLSRRQKGVHILQGQLVAPYVACLFAGPMEAHRITLVVARTYQYCLTPYHGSVNLSSYC